MRSQNLARALLRSALRNPTTAATTRNTLPTINNRLVASAAVPISTVSIRAFSSSNLALKKKNKKDAFAAVEQQEFDDSEDFAAIEEDDDLFGGISSSEASASGSSTSNPASTMTRVEFAKGVEDYRTALEWESIDKGQFPSLSKWRTLAANASSQTELEELLELAKLYRDRVGSLGVAAGRTFASRAGRINLPEIALNAFLDRYSYGLEYDLESLYMIQYRLARKLESPKRDLVLQSAEIEGAPVQESDLFGIVPNAEGETASEAKDGAEAQDGKAEAIETKHELDMPLARAQVSIIDRMSLAASLSTSIAAPTAATPKVAKVTKGPKTGKAAKAAKAAQAEAAQAKEVAAAAAAPSSSLDPTLLAYIPTAYITAFKLNQPNSQTNPLLTNIYARTDSLISLLTVSAQGSLANPSSSTQAINVVGSCNKRASRLGSNLSTILSYVAVRGQKKFKNIDTKGDKRPLDPVRTLYRYMNQVAKTKFNDLVRRIEPLLQQSQPSA